MHPLLFGLSQAAAQSSSIAVLDVSCSEQAPMCDSIVLAVRNQVQRQLASVDIHPIPIGKLTAVLSAQSIEPQCDLGQCEEKIAELIGAKWIINGKHDKATQAFRLVLYEGTQSKPLVETVLKAVKDDNVNARATTAVSTLLSAVLPDTSHEIGSLFANVPATVLGEGTLKIETNPPGVAFILDGEKRITTPYESKLPAGVHHLVIDDPCHWSKESRFLLSNGERLVKSINIIEKTANLDIKIKDAAPNNPKHSARVIVDDKQLGHTPFRQPISVCSKELALRTPTRFWSRPLQLKDGQYETHWINYNEMDVVVEEEDAQFKWGCSEQYMVAALATLGGGLTLGAVARSPVLASVALASAPVYFLGRWACESKSKTVKTVEPDTKQ